MNNIIFRINNPTIEKVIDVLTLSDNLPDDITSILDLGDFNRVDLLKDTRILLYTGQDGKEVEIDKLVGTRYGGLPIAIEFYKLHNIHWYNKSIFGVGDNTAHGRRIDLRAEYKIPCEEVVVLVQRKGKFQLNRSGGTIASIDIPLDIHDRVRIYRTVDAVYCSHPRFAIEAMYLGVPAICNKISETRRMSKKLKLMRRYRKRYIPGLSGEAKAIAKKHAKHIAAEQVARSFVDIHFPKKLGSAHIAMNVYNRPGVVVGALDAAMDQSYHCSVHVVNDGSTDNTRKVLDVYYSKRHAESFAKGMFGEESSTIKLTQLDSNVGAPASWNIAMQGDYDWVTYTSSDNIQMPGQMFELVRAGEVYGADVVISQYIVFGGVDALMGKDTISIEECLSSYGFGPSFVIRKHILNETDLMQEDMQGYEDTMLAIDIMLCMPKVYFHKKPLYYYRTADPSSLTFRIMKGDDEHWSKKSKKARDFLAQRSRDGIYNLRKIIVEDERHMGPIVSMCDNAGVNMRGDVVLAKDFSCEDCEMPGSTQMYISPNGIVKKCPYATYVRGRLDRYILFNQNPHQCMSNREPSSHSH